MIPFLDIMTDIGKKKKKTYFLMKTFELFKGKYFKWCMNFQDTRVLVSS